MFKRLFAKARANRAAAPEEKGEAAHSAAWWWWLRMPADVPWEGEEACLPVTSDQGHKLSIYITFIYNVVYLLETFGGLRPPPHFRLPLTTVGFSICVVLNRKSLFRKV